MIEEFDTEQVDTEQVDTEQVDTGQADAEQVDAEQIDTEQVDAEQVDTEQVDTEQIDTEQVDAEQIETHEITVAISHVNAPEMTESVSSVYTGDREAVEPPLPRVYAGSDIALQVKVSCSLACDFRGGMVEILAQDAVLTQVELSSFDDDDAVNQTDVFILAAPTEPGEYTWTAVFEPQEEENTPHVPVSASFTFIVEAHMLTLSSWNVPFPVIMGSKFTLKAGARCVGDCKLAGEQIMLYDQQGVLLATGVLGEEPLEGTAGVYWTELELDAPDEAGVYEWELKFSQPDRAPAHDDASHAVVFRAARPPEHLLTIEVTCDFEKIPVVNAWVAVTSEGVSYRAASDDAGMVSFNVPKGEYRLLITAEDHVALDSKDTIAVDGDQTVKIVMKYELDSYK
ncbi:MAG: hypothetical protein LBL86_02930 [Coriobacteriales bacterium]|nr:hypothetical protein [Coriobacteriales bacterium]